MHFHWGAMQGHQLHRMLPPRGVSLMRIFGRYGERTGTRAKSLIVLGVHQTFFLDHGISAIAPFVMVIQVGIIPIMPT